jgi:hypothetical protein
MKRILEIQPDHVAPRYHQGAYRAIAEFKNAFDDVVFGFFEHSRFGSLLHHHLDFFFVTRRPRLPAGAALASGGVLSR